jgi:hypothetical protein
MVVLSACLTSKAGKPLVARQFVDMSRIRIEGLLAAFPKLINTNHQHTYVETESVRYVYQPMEQLYLLLITNKSSNIMEDLETLRLLAKLVPEFCPELDEEGVREESCDNMLAFDEVLAMGHRETINLQQASLLPIPARPHSCRAGPAQNQMPKADTQNIPYVLRVHGCNGNWAWQDASRRRPISAACGSLHSHRPTGAGQDGAGDGEPRGEIAPDDSAVED